MNQRLLFFLPPVVVFHDPRVLFNPEHEVSHIVPLQLCKGPTKVTCERKGMGSDFPSYKLNFGGVNLHSDSMFLIMLVKGEKLIRSRTRASLGRPEISTDSSRLSSFFDPSLVGDPISLGQTETLADVSPHLGRQSSRWVSRRFSRHFSITVWRSVAGNL